MAKRIINHRIQNSESQFKILLAVFTIATFSFSVSGTQSTFSSVLWTPSSVLELCRGPECPSPTLNGFFPIPWWSLLRPSLDTLLQQASLEPDVVPVPMRGSTSQVLLEEIITNRVV